MAKKQDKQEKDPWRYSIFSPKIMKNLRKHKIFAIGLIIVILYISYLRWNSEYSLISWIPAELYFFGLGALLVYFLYKVFKK